MERKTGIIFTAGIVILLFIILVVVKKNDVSIKELKVNELKSTLVSKSNTILYVGKQNEKIINVLKKFKDDYALNVFYTEISVEEFNEKYSDQNFEIEKDSYILFYKNEPVVVLTGDEVKDKTLIYKYVYDVIPEEEREYKVLSTADEYLKKVNSKKYTVAVFGKESCTYCKLYLHTINDIAKEKNLNIYYFDADNYDINEYFKIIQELDYEIPEKCTANKTKTTMVKGFDKPLTIITKSGEMVDCLLGYVENETLENKLSEVGVIK